MVQGHFIANTERVARDVVVVGASAGGFKLLMKLAAALPGDLPAGVTAVLHRSPDFESSLPGLWQRISRLRVIEPTDGEPFEHGALYLAPRDRHLLLQRGCFRLSDGPRVHHTRPAADPLFESAAQAYGPRVLGVVLSGGDSDGAQGCRAITAKGGLTLAQDPREASDPSMPCRALGVDDVTAALPFSRIVEAIVTLASGRPFPI